jgi:hypothetical protein
MKVVCPHFKLGFCDHECPHRLPHRQEQSNGWTGDGCDVVCKRHMKAAHSGVPCIPVKTLAVVGEKPCAD